MHSKGIQAVAETCWSCWSLGCKELSGNGLGFQETLRVQVPHNHVILTQNLYNNNYCPKPKYLIVGYMDPLGNVRKRLVGPTVC